MNNPILKEILSNKGDSEYKIVILVEKSVQNDTCVSHHLYLRALHIRVDSNKNTSGFPKLNIHYFEKLFFIINLMIMPKILFKVMRCTLIWNKKKKKKIVFQLFRKRYELFLKLLLQK